MSLLAKGSRNVSNSQRESVPKGVKHLLAKGSMNVSNSQREYEVSNSQREYEVSNSGDRSVVIAPDS